MKIGQVLPNGAVVMDFTSGVILAKGEKGVAVGQPPVHVEYITWRWDGRDPASTVGDHYFSVLSEAAKNFEERVKAQGGVP